MNEQTVKLLKDLRASDERLAENLAACIEVGADGLDDEDDYEFVLQAAAFLKGSEDGRPVS